MRIRSGFVSNSSSSSFVLFVTEDVHNKVLNSRSEKDNKPSFTDDEKEYLNIMVSSKDMSGINFKCLYEFYECGMSIHSSYETREKLGKLRKDKNIDGISARMLYKDLCQEEKDCFVMGENQNGHFES